MATSSLGLPIVVLGCMNQHRVAAEVGSFGGGEWREREGGEGRGDGAATFYVVRVWPDP